MAKPLYKLREGRIISGVCAGGAGVIAYIAAAMLLPEK